MVSQPRFEPSYPPNTILHRYWYNSLFGCMGLGFDKRFVVYGCLFKDIFSVNGVNLYSGEWKVMKELSEGSGKAAVPAFT